MRETYASVPPARKLRDATFTALTLGTWVDGSIPIRSGSSVAAPALSAQGSCYAWDTTATAGFKDTSRAWNCLATDVIGTALRNTTPSTDANRVQYSPILAIGGRAYRHTAGAEDQAWDWGMQVRPVAGASAATTSALHFLSRSYIGGVWGTWTSSGSISQSGILNFSNGISAGSTSIVTQNQNTGLGIGSSLRGTYDGVQQIINASRSDGANNVVIASVYDRNAASITNAATMRLHSFGWTNNADAYTELAAIMCDGTYVSSYSRNLLTNYVDGIRLENTTAALVGAKVQNSPVLGLYGRQWSAGGADQGCGFGWGVVPTADSSSGIIYLLKSVAGGPWVSSGVYGDMAGGWSTTVCYSTGSFYNFRASVGNGGATAYQIGLALYGTTAAVAGPGVTVQDSTAIIWSGSAWNTTTPTSDVIDFACKVVPSSGATTSGTLQFGYRNTAGGVAPGKGGGQGSGNFATVMTLTSAGDLTTTALNVGSITIGTSGGSVLTHSALGNQGTTVYQYGYLARNITASTVGAQVQESPASIYGGTAWNTADSVSWGLQMGVKVLPVISTTTAVSPTAIMYWGFRSQSGVVTPTGNFATVASLHCGTGQFLVNGRVQAFAGTISMDRSNTAWGTGVGGGEICVTGATYQTILGQTGYTQAANAKLIVSCYVPPGNVATLTHPATMRLHAFGWTSETAGPTYTFVEAASIRPNGDLYVNGGANAQALAIQSLTEETTVAVGEATKSTTIQIPTGAVVMAVTGRVTQAPGTTATFNIGVDGATTRYATGVSSALGTTWLGTLDATRYYSSATSIVITPNTAPVTTNGKLRITIHYYLPTAPTS